MPRWVANILLVLLVVGIPPFIALSNTPIFLNPAWLDYEYGKQEVPKSERFNDKDRRYYATESIEFERGNRTFEQLQSMGVYNERELNHMVDVRVLLAQLSTLYTMDGILLAVILLVLASVPATRVLAARGVFTGGLLTLLLFVSIGVFMATAFDAFFTEFHYVFFEGVSGFFLATDSLIQFYPEQFWSDTFLAIAGVILVESIAVAVVGWLWLRRASHV
jgi:integral membrane protein (TIGR01906 family)